MKQEYRVNYRQLQIHIDQLYESLKSEDDTAQFKVILSQIHELTEQKACLDEKNFYDHNTIVTSSSELSLIEAPSVSPHIQQYYIYENATCRQVGEIDYRDFKDDYLGDIGYHIFPNYQGHHYAEKALSLLLHHLQKNNIEQVIITVYDDNIASIKTIERNGGVPLLIVILKSCLIFVPRIIKKRRSRVFRIIPLNKEKIARSLSWLPLIKKL